MPTVWRQGKYKISIYKESNHACPHLHVYLGKDKSASISLEGVVLANSGMTESDLKFFVALIAANKAAFENVWRECND